MHVWFDPLFKVTVSLSLSSSHQESLYCRTKCNRSYHEHEQQLLVHDLRLQPGQDNAMVAVSLNVGAQGQRRKTKCCWTSLKCNLDAKRFKHALE